MASGAGKRWRAAAADNLPPASPGNTYTPPEDASGTAGYGAGKLLADFCGQPMILHVLRAIDASAVTEKIAVTRAPEIETLCKEAAFPCLLHDKPLLSDTIRLGLARLCQTQTPDCCLFFQSDQPLITAASINALIAAFSQAPAYIYRLSWQGKPGSPVLFPRRFFSELMQLPPDQGGGVLLKKYPESVRLINAQFLRELRDADTPEELEDLIPT